MSDTANDIGESVVAGCTGAFDDDGFGYCRCCSMDEFNCRCDPSTRDPSRSPSPRSATTSRESED